MCVWVCVYIYISVCVCVYIYIYICVCVCVYIYMCVCVCVFYNISISIIYYLQHPHHNNNIVCKQTLISQSINRFLAALPSLSFSQKMVKSISE